MRPRSAGARLFSLALLGSGVAFLWVLTGSASAHAHVHVDPYEFTVGWRDEPPVVGSVNGLDLGIKLHDGANNTTTPVEGAQGSLEATLSAGGSSVAKALAPQFGSPGSYTFDVIPTREGAYSVRITGTLNGTLVNITVALQEPTARADLEFPAAEPTPGELSQQISSLEAAHARLEARAAALEAGSATSLAVAGLAAGAAGAVMGGLAWRAARAKRSP